jgi:hypothetical protein
LATALYLRQGNLLIAHQWATLPVSEVLMAKGFQYRDIFNFPKMKVEEIYETLTQPVLPWVEEGFDDSIHSTITYLGKSAHPDFLRFHVEHETLRPYRVRFNNVRRDSVIVVETFDLFIAQNYSYSWADTSSKNVNELLRRVIDTERDRDNKFSFVEHQIDLIQMGRDIQLIITGGHFNELRIADVRAAALFGEGVGGSADWQRYEDHGKLSAIVFQMPFYGTLQRTMVTKNGGIVIFSNFNEQDVITLIEKVNEEVRKHIVAAYNTEPIDSSDQDLLEL